MQTDVQRPAQCRVLMRIPNVGQAATPQRPAKATSAAAQWPQLPLSAEAQVQQPGDVARSDMPTPPPEEEHSRWRSPLTALAAVAVVSAALIAIGNRNRQASSPPANEVPSDSQRGPSILGGSPREITQIPELSLPSPAQAAGYSLNAADFWLERLPPVPPAFAAPLDFEPAGPEGEQTWSDPAAQPLTGGYCGLQRADNSWTRGTCCPPWQPGPSDAGPKSENTWSDPGAQPRTARLEGRIEPPTPEANYDASRQGLY